VRLWRDLDGLFVWREVTAVSDQSPGYVAQSGGAQAGHVGSLSIRNPRKL